MPSARGVRREGEGLAFTAETRAARRQAPCEGSARRRHDHGQARAGREVQSEQACRDLRPGATFKRNPEDTSLVDGGDALGAPIGDPPLREATQAANGYA